MYVFWCLLDGRVYTGEMGGQGKFSSRRGQTPMVKTVTCGLVGLHHDLTKLTIPRAIPYIKTFYTKDPHGDGCTTCTRQNVFEDASCMLYQRHGKPRQSRKVTNLKGNIRGGQRCPIVGAL